MGIDTRFFGPSAWQLFHLIAFFSPNPQDTLLDIKDMLPCKFCRASTTEYTATMPISSCDDPGRWLYDLHNKVNAKLRSQSKKDPTILAPPPDPTFEEVKARYEQIKPTAVPGRDFLMSVAVNYGDTTPIECDVQAVHKTFWIRMTQVYPFEELREIVAKYVKAHAVESALKDRASYSKWVYGLLKRLSSKVKAPIASYHGYMQHVMFYKSWCAKKTYKGKTCRKLSGGGLTKKRDHRKTYRVTHKRLLSFKASN